MNPSPRDYGRQCGLAMQPLASNLPAVERQAEAERAGEQARLEALHRDASNRLGACQRDLDRREARLQLAETEWSRLVQEHGQSAEGSLVLGLLFLVLSATAVVGDVAFLGPILGQLLGTEIRDAETHLGFAALVLAHFPRAAARFPELIALTVSVLTSGFTIKVWHDGLRASPGANLRRPWFWVQSIVLVLSLSMLALLSLVRFQVPLGGALDGFAARAASALLGFSLPLVGAVFFEAGRELVGGRLRLWAADLRRWREVSRHTRTQRRKNDAAQKVEALAADASQLSGSVGASAFVGARKSEFLAGYREGLAAAFQQGAQSPFQLVRRAALVKAIGGQQ